MNAKIRILVAEDHLVARVGVTAIVNMQPDMTVVAEASNGQQAVELYRKQTPDVALLDMRMPIMSGVEAATAIRSEFPNARMIVETRKHVYFRPSPDGERIAFVSARMGFKDEALYTDAPQPYGDLFVMRYDGSGVEQLTDNQWEDGTPAWQPRPRLSTRR